MATKGRRIVKGSYAVLEGWFKGETIRCIEPLPEDAKLVGVRQRCLDTVELCFESAEWPDVTAEASSNVFPEITPIFQGMVVADPGE